MLDFLRLLAVAFTSPAVELYPDDPASLGLMVQSLQYDVAYLDRLTRAAH